MGKGIAYYFLQNKQILGQIGATSQVVQMQENGSPASVGLCPTQTRGSAPGPHWGCTADPRKDHVAVELRS